MANQEKEIKDQAGPDRRLGDEWTDWDGTVQQDQPEASSGLYIALMVVVILVMSGAGWLISWLIGPRFEQMQAGYLVKWLLYGWLGFFGLWGIMVILAAMGAAWLRKPLTWLGGIRWSMTLSLLAGTKLGLSKDKIGNAYIKLHNKLEMLPRIILDPEKLLVLAPRCLSRDSLQGLKTLKETYGFSQVIAIGGSEARKGIAQIRPKGIIAIACERDLLSGIKDVNGRIPIVAFTNVRPEGPCKNTMIPLDSIEKTVKILLGK